MSSPTVVRSAALLAAVTALTALPVLPAAAEGAADPGGSASATTAELALHVGLLDHAVDIPVDVALNKVQSPAELHGSVLTAVVQGVAQSGPVTLVRADAGSSSTHRDASGAHAAVQLVNAGVNAPGLPDRTLIGLDALAAEADCPADGAPTARVTMPARLTVLGRPVTLSLTGSTHVPVPGIGTLDVQYAPRTTTSSTAAASALVVTVALNPLNLNVATVQGTITVASVSCTKPAAPTAAASASPSASAAPVPSDSPSAAQPSDAASVAQPAAAVSATSSAPAAPSGMPAGTPSGTPSVTPTKHPRPGTELAFTGSAPVLPLAGAGAALLVAGGGVLALARHRKKH
ncbi:hypothetical protein ACFYNO_24580 [Kitasatospora sp. NPDC006697]|uniref:hypothetical protein n=1 Tax=Kitasatospora sp. NPDC006697 TaxID=3364020 RepID=UPI0036907435